MSNDKVDVSQEHNRGGIFLFFFLNIFFSPLEISKSKVLYIYYIAIILFSILYNAVGGKKIYFISNLTKMAINKSGGHGLRGEKVIKTHVTR